MRDCLRPDAAGLRVFSAELLLSESKEPKDGESNREEQTLCGWLRPHSAASKASELERKPTKHEVLEEAGADAKLQEHCKELHMIDRQLSVNSFSMLVFWFIKKV